MVYRNDNNTIITKRLLLRKLVYEDAQRIVELCNNEKIYKTTLSIPKDYTYDDALIWISTHEYNFQNDRLYQFGITDKITGEIYGAVTLSNNQKHRSGELGYWIGESYWKNGYATEATEAILNFAFEVKNYHKVFGCCMSGNIASSRVMEKNNMIKEGLLKDSILKDNKFYDVLYYGLINDKEVV